MARTPTLPPRDLIADDTPLRLDIAAALAYPDGSMTARDYDGKRRGGGLRSSALPARITRPRPAKGARLWLRPEERNPDGTLRKRAVWVIRDGPRKISTSCAAQDRTSAERALGEHLANKYQPSRERGRHPSEILIADVLAIYLSDVAHRHARENETKQRVLTLDTWWGDSTLDEVNGANCRAYVEHRLAEPWKAAKPDRTGRAPRMVTAAAARRELEDLRAAIKSSPSGGVVFRGRIRGPAGTADHP